MPKYTFIAEPFGVELVASGENLKAARKLAFQQLTESQRDNCECLDWVDEEPESPQAEREADIAELSKAAESIDDLLNDFRYNPSDWVGYNRWRNALDNAKERLKNAAAKVNATP